MLFEKDIVQKDMEEIVNQSYIPYDKLKGKTVLITGASGMLAHYFTCVLMFLNIRYNYNIKVLALVRNKEKAEKKFGCFLKMENFSLVVQDICEEISIEEPVDYIVHAAGNASPYFIKNDPVGIIEANVTGTINVLEFAKKNPVKNILYTSTREIYGKIDDKEWIEEGDQGILDPLDPRSCYPESKRMAEQIFESYYVSHNVPFTVARIAHSYGPGMILGNDGRVMADFMTCAVNNQDIVLKSAGDAVRAFCYITDAVAGMFCCLLNGEFANAYNIANETEPKCIRDVAQMLIDVCNNGTKLVFVNNVDQSVYCNYKRVGLSTKKLEKLGWTPHVSLQDGLHRTLRAMKEDS